MQLPPNRAILPWMVGVSVGASLACLIIAISLGSAARTDATNRAVSRLITKADVLARQIDTDLALFDAALREAARPPMSREGPARTPVLDLPLTARYVWFMNVLNEVGDVVADSRSNVSRPVNFAGRDYFQDHLKNPADIMMIGRPFGIAPNQHPAIPISRRLTAPDGGFGGVVVAGVNLSWLSDLLVQSPRGGSSVTIRRDDGVILMRFPMDADAIGRGGSGDEAWRDYLRTGRSLIPDGTGGQRLFRRAGAAPVVLELAVDRAEIDAGERSWLLWLAPLTLIPALCVLGLSLIAFRLRQASVRTEEGAHAANEDRKRLLATMSHELRTPLTGILGHAELLAEDGSLNDRQTARLAKLTGAGALMRTIINRVTNIARPESHGTQSELTSCDLDQLIRVSTSVVESEARKKGLHLSTVIDPGTPARLVLAGDMVQQVIINLLWNAIKFTALGTVALRVRWNGEILRFEVADTGPGISGKHRLFRAYDRLDATASTSAGTGLGLSITEGFVRRMGGRIGHQNNPGGGSLFWVELPTLEPRTAEPMSAKPNTVEPSTVGPNTAEPKTPSPEATGTPRATTLPEPARDIRALRVLLADDLDLTRSVTADFLRSAGHAVTEVPDGQAAIDAVETRDFDVVLTDMRMPVMDGLEATRRIRALSGHRGQIPVVLVTADLAALGQGASGQAGVDLCLMKPFTRTELLVAVETAARLTFQPGVGSGNSQVLDGAVLAELRVRLGAMFTSHLQAAMRRIEALIGLLESPDAAESPSVAETVHDLIGVAGLLGLIELSSCLRRFDIAENRSVPAVALREAATDAVRALRRQQEPAAVPAARGQRSQDAPRTMADSALANGPGLAAEEQWPRRPPTGS